MAGVDDTIERCLLVKSEVYVYNIPPRQSARGYRAADWNLATPNWTGRMRCMVKATKLTIRLEDKNNGELFAACPVEQYPGMSVEPVTDSSRYFVICVQDAGRKAYIGLGFADRSDSFDLNVALQDHFKYLKKESEFGKEQLDQGPKLDLAFKAGQTIRINIPNKKGDEESDKPAANNRLNRGGGIGGVSLPPPPPGGVPGRIGPPPGAANLTPLQSPSSGEPPKQPVIGSSNVDLLGDLMSPTVTTAAPPQSMGGLPCPPPQAAPSNDDPWGDFASASSVTSKASGNWETF